jgi:serine/threonine kinase 32
MFIYQQVCIVRHRATRRHYALKYMCKRRCVQRAAVGHVLRELDLLTELSHPLLVNLCFAFQVRPHATKLIGTRFSG